MTQYDAWNIAGFIVFGIIPVIGCGGMWLAFVMDFVGWIKLP